MRLHAGAHRRLLATVFLAALAAGCGGGGGGSGGDPLPAPAPPAPPPPPASQVLNWGEFPAAAVVIGKQNFEDGDSPVGTSPIELNFPLSAAVSEGILYVAETGAGQVKAYRQYDAQEAVGQAASFSFATPNAYPTSVSIQGQRLVVVDDESVAIYNSLPDGTGEPVAGVFHANTFLCSSEGLSHPRAALLTPLGHLIVADSDNNRVLIWNPGSVPEFGPLPGADVVIGQQNMNTCMPNDSQGNGATGTPTAVTLNNPTSVWSDGEKLIVVDRNNNRVLMWDRIPTEHFQPAAHVIGQTGFEESSENAGLDAPTAATLFKPIAVDVSDSGQLAIADRNNNRVLIWNAIPQGRGQAADQVVGQPNLVSGGDSDASAQTLDGPSGVRFDGRNLIVVDSSNNRVVVFRATN